MFTGIVEEIGCVRALQRGAQSASLSIETTKILEDAHLGDSIAVCGVCLTVTSLEGKRFTADVMHETLERSTLGRLQTGSLVNLERALAADGRFGGHIVSGHIDGTGVVVAISRDDNAIWYRIRTEPALLRYSIEKGSIAIDGISLTVARVSAADVSVSVIPHTADKTTLSARRVGDRVNLECDCIGKYVEKLLGGAAAPSGIQPDFLSKFGY